MLRIRLTRKGKKRQPTYRVVVADIESPRDGRYVEQIGHYDPMQDPIAYKINEARALHWLSVGAQPSDAVNRLLVKQGTIDRLARLRAGEELGALAAEFDGTEYEAEDAGVVANARAAVSDAVEAVQERAADALENAPEAVQDAVDTVREAAADAATAIAGAITGLADRIAGDEDTEAETVEATESDDDTNETYDVIEDGLPEQVADADGGDMAEEALATLDEAADADTAIAEGAAEVSTDADEAVEENDAA